MNQEMYQEDGVTKSRQSKIDWSSARIDKMSLQTMIEIIAKAGYEVKKLRNRGIAPILDFRMFLMGKNNLKYGRSQPVCKAICAHKNIIASQNPEIEYSC